MTDRVVIAAHAKVNLLLRVLSREASGYHSLETLFTLLEAHDELTVERAANGIELTVEGWDTGPVEENLVFRAAEAVLKATGSRFGVRIHLVKRIPVRAGLGGGSSDGAAALHAVNSLAENAVPQHELLQFAARLGSDMPFFASGASFALAWGRGERLLRLPAPKSAPVLIVFPAFGISTKVAYGLIDAAQTGAQPRGAVVLDQTVFETWGGIGRLGGNDFESVVFQQEPMLRGVFERLAETRPLLVRLSGSGSAVFAIYKNDAERDAAAMSIGERDGTLLKTDTRQAPAPPVRAT
jgi:4-diphosphocytidyl-2-C-methyl-D-erythritol kinase